MIAGETASGQKRWPELETRSWSRASTVARGGRLPIGSCAQTRITPSSVSGHVAHPSTAPVEVTHCRATAWCSCVGTRRATSTLTSSRPTTTDQDRCAGVGQRPRWSRPARPEACGTRECRRGSRCPHRPVPEARVRRRHRPASAASTVTLSARRSLSVMLVGIVSFLDICRIARRAGPVDARGT
jgi:hypothetical protein